MVDKNVNLVIRGKDQGGSKVVEAVTGAIAELKAAQADLASGAKTTDSVLGQLGAEFKTLSAEVNKLNAIGKVAAELDRAAGSVKRLQSDTQGVASDFAKAARDAERASTSVARMRGEIDALSRVYEEQRAATAASRREQTEATKGLERAERAYEKLQGAIARSGQGKAAVSAEVFGAADLDKARVAAAGASEAYARLKGEQEATKTTLGSLNEQLKEAVANERTLQKQATNLADATLKQKAALTGARSELDQITDAAREAGIAFDGLTVDQRELGSNAQRAAVDLERTRRVMQAMDRFSGGGGVFVDPRTASALQKQRAEIDQTRGTWKTLEEEVRRLATAMAQSVAPTQAQATAFAQATAAARAAKAEYLAQQAALARLQGNVQSTFNEFARAHFPLRQIKQDIEAVGNASQQAGQKVGLLRTLFQAFYGDSRKAMSLLQRLRGEVLSFAAANLGLYAALGQVGGVITAYQSLEAAQSRLGVVFKQDSEVIRTELTWLDRQASRLGISFQILSDEYSKFAVAADAANFSASSTRSIFLSVAEAGRVNKLSLEQMSGVFLALTQMISKGKVSAEELRRQLGDRLAGAFNIFADAIGVSTAELDDMMRKGEVIADETNLLKFADELKKRFGPQLAQALKTTTTNLGRFQNAIFQAQLRVADGGFIDGLNKGLEALNEYFDSREGRDFFLSIGAALGKLVSALAVVPEHFDDIGFAIKALLALKLAQWGAGVFESMMSVSAGARQEAAALVTANGALLTYGQLKVRLAGWIASAVASIRVFTGTVATSAAGIGFASARTAAWTAGIGLLRGALVGAAAVARGLWVAIGGPVGLIIGALTFLATDLLGRWAGGVDETTSALDEHKRIMSEVLSAYEQAIDKTGAWAKGIKNVTLDQANANVRALRTQLDKFRKAVSDFAPDNFDLVLSGAAFDPLYQDLQKTREAFARGEVSADEFVAKLQEVYAATDNDALRRFIEQFLDLARKTQGVETALSDAAVMARDMGSTLDGLDKDAGDTTRTTRDLTGAVAEVSAGMDHALASIRNYQNAMSELGDKIPGVAEELKKLKELAEIDASFNVAIANARNVGQATAAYNSKQQAQLAVLMGTVSDSVLRSAEMLLAREGFISTPKLDTDGRLRIGMGSDTVTLSDNSVHRVVEGMAIGFEDGVRDLVRRIGEFQSGIKEQIGAERFAAFSPEAQAALTSIAYNYGSLPNRIIDAVKTGSAEEIAAAIRGLGDDNGGINRSRRDAEANAVLGSRLGISESNAEREADITEELAKQAELTKQAIADAEFELKQTQLMTAGKERQAAIEEAIRSVRQQNANVSEEDIALLTATVGKTYDLKNARDAVKKAEEEVNRLYEMRGVLIDQIELAQGLGQNEKATALQATLTGVNAQLAEAVEKAIALARTLGGPDMDLVIAKLETVALKAGDIGVKSKITGEQINGMIASGLTSAVERFAAAFASGENALDSWRNAFLQFAGEFLIEIGKMILQQAILNALQGGGGANGGVGGTIASFIAALFHEGGVAGRGGRGRIADAAWFQNAYRYHTGGIAGLKPDEVPAILQKNEEILTEDDPRHIFNQGAGGAAPVMAKIINMLDAGDFISEGLASRVGQRTIINFMRANKSQINAALTP